MIARVHAALPGGPMQSGTGAATRFDTDGTW